MKLLVDFQTLKLILSTGKEGAWKFEYENFSRGYYGHGEKTDYFMMPVQNCLIFLFSIFNWKDEDQ